MRLHCGKHLGETCKSCVDSPLALSPWRQNCDIGCEACWHCVECGGEQTGLRAMHLSLDGHASGCNIHTYARTRAPPTPPQHTHTHTHTHTHAHTHTHTRARTHTHTPVKIGADIDHTQLRHFCEPSTQSFKWVKITSALLLALEAQCPAHKNCSIAPLHLLQPNRFILNEPSEEKNALNFFFVRIDIFAS